jgi:cell division protein FtsL
MPLRVGRRVPDRLLDRLIRGRAWIAVIAFALIGIVAMQLWVVKLGVGIGRALEHTQLLQQENATLASEDSALSSAERIERLALAKGMVPASPAALHFDTLRGPLDARLAAAALAKPIQAPTSTSTTVGGADTEPSTGTPAANASSASGESSAASGEPSVASGEPSVASGEPSVASGEPSSTSATAGTAANPGSTTSMGGETTGAGATPAQAPTTPETTAAQAPTPAPTEVTPTTTGGAPEATGASGAGGGTQAAPGG